MNTVQSREREAEAMSCELSVVARSVGGISKVIEKVGSGILVDSKDVTQIVDATFSLIANRELRENLGRSKTIITGYIWNPGMDRLLRYCQSLV